jgi:SCP-2 sterol transfer family
MAHRPLQNKPETVYVVPSSDAEEFVARRFPHKKPKRVSNGLAGQGTIRAFLRGLNFVFQKGQSKGLNAVYHFTFTGHEEVKATVTIRDEKLHVSEGHKGKADLRLTADTETWLRFLRKEANLAWAVLRRKIRVSGSPKLLLAFGRCFPSWIGTVLTHLFLPAPYSIWFGLKPTAVPSDETQAVLVVS